VREARGGGGASSSSRSKGARQSSPFHQPINLFLFLFFLTQHHRVLAHDPNGERALPDGLERVLDLEPDEQMGERIREGEKE